MAEVILFHHALGLSAGITAFADELRAEGHAVHTPDLFDGERPPTIDDGMALIGGIGDDVLRERADRYVAGRPEDLVYAGFSVGAGTAQRLAQTVPAYAAHCSTKPACRSLASGPSGRGPPESRFRSTA